METFSLPRNLVQNSKETWRSSTISNRWTARMNFKMDHFILSEIRDFPDFFLLWYAKVSRLYQNICSISIYAAVLIVREDRGAIGRARSGRGKNTDLRMKKKKVFLIMFLARFAWLLWRRPFVKSSACVLNISSIIEDLKRRKTFDKIGYMKCWIPAQKEFP